MADKTKWDKKELALALAFTGAAMADWGQTRNIVNRRHPEKYYEQNPILGKNPSKGQVDTYMPVAILGALGIAHALPKKYRKKFLSVLTAVELGVVGHNKKIGLKIDF